MSFSGFLAAPIKTLPGPSQWYETRMGAVCAFDGKCLKQLVDSETGLGALAPAHWEARRQSFVLELDNIGQAKYSSAILMQGFITEFRHFALIGATS